MSLVNINQPCFDPYPILHHQTDLLYHRFAQLSALLLTTLKSFQCLSVAYHTSSPIAAHFSPRPLSSYFLMPLKHVAYSLWSSQAKSRSPTPRLTWSKSPGSVIISPSTAINWSLILLIWSERFSWHGLPLLYTYCLYSTNLAIQCQWLHKYWY